MILLHRQVSTRMVRAPPLLLSIPATHLLLCKSCSPPLPPPKAMPVGAAGLPPYPTVDATGPESRRARQNGNRVPRLDTVVVSQCPSYQFDRRVDDSKYFFVLKAFKCST